ncbi:MAG TPA: D-2-hydroxyacid dehydrogenase [Bacteroidales bacterium]|jgi:glycerate dehydrogenase|nr:D-2-hydroxyacid dehydrogenase [Bacteroidales bacterium]
MKIVILDGYTINPGDLSWDGLKALGELVVYDRTAQEQVYERAAGAEILLINKAVLGGDMLKKLPDLKYVGVLATGYNVIDLEEATRHGIIVTNVPAYSTDSVAQMTFALILELCLHVQRHSDSVMSGRWASCPDFSYREYPLIELASKTLGIIGYGNIGRKVGQIGCRFGMNVIVAGSSARNRPTKKNIYRVSLAELLSQSDIVTIHCPLTPETRGLINIDNLRLMKPSAFLINTSRGPVVVEQDLAFALNEGLIGGAGLDVLSVEPPSPDNPLFNARNCLITPHIAWATLEARKRLIDIAVNNIRAFINGSPINVVN